MATGSPSGGRGCPSGRAGGGRLERAGWRGPAGGDGGLAARPSAPPPACGPRAPGPPRLPWRVSAARRHRPRRGRRAPGRVLELVAAARPARRSPWRPGGSLRKSRPGAASPETRGRGQAPPRPARVAGNCPEAPPGLACGPAHPALPPCGRGQPLPPRVGTWPRRSPAAPGGRGALRPARSLPCAPAGDSLTSWNLELGLES